MIDSSKYFKFFSTCQITNGHNRSLILDSQRNNFVAIPNEMHEIVIEFQKKRSINEVIFSYGEESVEVINEYVDFLIENEFGLIVDKDEFDLFIDADTSFEIASHITNCIVEISKETTDNIDKISIELELLNCKDVQFICYEDIEISTLRNLLEATKDINFRSIELVLKYSAELLAFINEIANINLRVVEVILHTSKGQNKEVQKGNFNVFFIDFAIKDFKNCGVVDLKYFSRINKYKVLESLNHNSCLNKKISIDKNGNIRNCPAMAESFGNIKDTSLAEALNRPTFKKYWDINKDQINICKDCEFRHICTDCRAYIENPEDQYSKPLKCGYNPYTNVWEEWSTNPLKQKAILYYGMNELLGADENLNT
jgi:SPASM domain peptide maturase of grasp-with-spasm system